ncbi:hypothetical protein SAMN05421788_101228 [Filimonas lacunae]|uniref:Uncharacterized protein n=1 Tax=Filimonas lacunae TaxID=477680 RepID=A0A173MMA6_9BACT|nr:hypothetical protein [Filimonas lacunae]BAV08772.1 hypothetical protein FLA_4819 [Filimonas lacunae]SIS61501.1 hypothetical protein SAMN05421788_101228 [Filimonas lacunae]
MLTEEQIKRLEVYCHKKGIRYYDLQTELVDHMATAIETECEQHPEETFDVVANRIAPVFAAEWPKLVKETRRQLVKEYLRLTVQSFLEYFTWPKISLTVLLITAAVLGEKYMNIHKFPGLLMQILVLVGYSFAFTKRGKVVKQNVKEYKTPLLCMAVLANIHILIGGVPVWYLSMNVYSWLTPDDYSPFLFSLSVYLAPLAILIMLSWRKVYTDIHDRIRKNYSGAFRTPSTASVVHV